VYSQDNIKELSGISRVHSISANNENIFAVDKKGVLFTWEIKRKDILSSKITSLEPTKTKKLKDFLYNP